MSKLDDDMEFDRVRVPPKQRIWIQGLSQCVHQLLDAELAAGIRV